MTLKLFGKKSKTRSIIGIAAGKGGVGKSSLTVNLALALKSLGYSVGVLDADIYGPSIRTMLPEDKLPVQEGEILLPALSQGISTISIAYFHPNASVVRAPIANGWISRFLNQVKWGDLDFLFIDFPPGTGDIQITLSQQAALTGAIIVTTPQEIALQDVRKCVTMFDQVNVPLIGIVENMSFYQPNPESEKVYLFGKGGGRKLADETGTSLLGQIPIDPLIGDHLDKGSSLFSSNNTLTVPLKAHFLEIARKISSFVPKETLTIRAITQKNPQAITIEWTDGVIQECLLESLQRNCPCAGCKDGKMKLERNDPLQAKSIRNVGRYALQIDFTSGCSHGIFDYELIRKMS